MKYKVIVEDTCRRTCEAFDTCKISATFETVLSYQDTLETFVKTINNAFLQDERFTKDEYVECMEIIFQSKEYIYISYFRG